MKKCLQFQQLGYDIDLSLPEFIIGFPTNNDHKGYSNQVSEKISEADFT